MGIATRIAVRLTPLPPTVATLLADFSDLGDAAAAVTGIIAAGIVPAALEMMDAVIVEVVEAYVHAGFPTDAAAVLLVEVDGLPGGVEEQTRRVRDVLLAHHAGTVRVAGGPAERALWWKGRKSAFGAVARIAPNYYLHDCVVPRTRLVEVLAEVRAIAARHELILGNVFHAGDGNLHPLIVFDRRIARGPRTGPRRRARRSSKRAWPPGAPCPASTGSDWRSADAMPLVFSAADLEAQKWLRDAFDPAGRCNPEKVLPRGGSGCGDLAELPAGAWV